MFPSLVLAVGLFLTLVGQQALRGSNTSFGKHQLGRQVTLVASSLRVALDQADPMLEQLASFALEHDAEKPLEPAAAVLRDLIQGRPGVAFVSISFPDGAFQGAYVDRDGSVRFQESRVGTPGGIRRRFDYAGHQRLTLLRQESTDYDPRRRDFYQQALRVGARTWTKPYAFYLDHFTGVTRAVPIFKTVGAEQRLHAVLTVDFDVNELSKLLRVGHVPDMRTLLYTSDGTLLAYPEGAQAIAALSLKEDRALSFSDLRDPTLDAFFTAARTLPVSENVTELSAAAEKYWATRAPVGADASLDWSVAYVVPERVFMASLHSYGTRSAVIAGVAVLLALGVSLAFARLVVRVRREAAEARAEARRATHEAKELGSYRLVKCLGKGGMGEVWRAQHRLLAREAAVKLIRLDGGAATAEAQERFRREAQTLSALRSRNTIELFDYGVSDDGTFFYVMELLDGLDLESLVSRYGPQPAGRVLRLLQQACRSLAEAHDAGLVHRDIKPANLFVCRAADEVDVVKVLDFGLVRSHADAAPASSAVVERSTIARAAPLDSHLTQQGSVMGTPEFMAPEQALGQELDGRADIYALGCVGYWLACGRLLFEKGNAMQLLLAHISEVPTSISAERDRVSAALGEVIMTCVAKAPADRPQSARELLQLLSEVERELPASERWTDEQAQAWWQKYQPVRRSSQPGAAPTTEQIRIADAATHTA
ncbi:MAG: protein kinase [Polyangiaceae bacterium]